MTNFKIWLAASAAICALAPATASASGSLTQTAQGFQTAAEGSKMTGGFYCAAAAPDALSVNITACYLRTSDGQVYDSAPRFRTAGPASATAGALVRVPTTSYRICMSTEVIWLDGSQSLPSETCFG
jgi:hypothetical protein